MLLKSALLIKISTKPLVALRTFKKLYPTWKKMDYSCTDIVWMDLEMTGLDVHKDKIIEVSCIITDEQLNIKSEGPCLAINYPKDVFGSMNDWCIKHHNKSGLVEKCLKSTVSQEQAEDIIMQYLRQNIPEKQCPLAGNSIYMDRLFLRDHMPKVDNYLHYRIIDVSTIKELAKRWNNSVYSAAPVKKLVHRSLDDIKESIAELKYYREKFFNSN